MHDSAAKGRAGTLVVAVINLNDGQTNAIEGMTHFALFLTFLMLTGLGL
jgi:Ca2+:H+ antiporter